MEMSNMPYCPMLTKWKFWPSHPRKTAMCGLRNGQAGTCVPWSREAGDTEVGGGSLREDPDALGIEQIHLIGQ